MFYFVTMTFYPRLIFHPFYYSKHLCNCNNVSNISHKDHNFVILEEEEEPQQQEESKSSSGDKSNLPRCLPSVPEDKLHRVNSFFY